MMVGYARVSTAEQENGLAAQIEELKQQGCEEVFEEMISATAGSRVALPHFIPMQNVSKL